MKNIGVFLLGALLVVSASFSTEKAQALLMNRAGEVVGKAELIEGSGGVLITVRASGLPPNAELAFHIHERGECVPPSFKSAKGHYNPEGKEHGLLNPKGHHAGDMPNVFTDANGKLRVDIFNSKVTLKSGKPNSLFKKGGTAIVLHEKGDDYRSNPAGNAGKRIICGVIKR